MFVRMNTVTGAEDIDAGLAYLRDTVVREVRGQRGYRGLTVSGNRSTGDFGILTLWDTREDLEASESSVSKLRQEAMKAIGGAISVAVLEQVYADVASQDLTGHPLRIQQVRMDPARLDEHVAFFTSTVAPELKAASGFLAVRNMLNRATGQGTVGTIWADEASMRAVEAKDGERRERAKARGVELSDPSYRTILLSDLV